MKRWCRISLPAFALVLALGAGPAFCADELSPAEQRVFADKHLQNLPASAVLSYAYRKNAAGQPAVDDEVVLTTRTEAERGRVVEVDYLHGERHMELPAIDNAEGNPIILYFLESDVRTMRRELGGMENYFRRRIRLALAEEATTRPVRFEYAGGSVEGTEVTVRPYADDPLKDRFRGMAHKAYVFTLSDKVPGGVYQLRSTVDARGGESAAPVVEEVLTLKGVKP